MNRSRGRGRKPSNPLNRTMESNGPDVKVRGTPHQICDKYLTLARDANVAGDRVAYEGYLQHAEHFHRIILSSQPANGAQPSPQSEGAEDGIEEEATEVVANGNGRNDGQRNDGQRGERPARARRPRRGRNPRHGNGEAEQGEPQGNIAEGNVAVGNSDPVETKPVEHTAPVPETKAPAESA